MRNLISVISILALLILASSHPVSAQPKIEDAIVAVAWSPDGSKLAVANLDTSLTVYDTSNMQVLYSLNNHTNSVISDLAWSPNGQYLAVSSGNNSISIINADSGLIEVVLSGHQDNVYTLCWRPDGMQLATGSQFEQSTFRLWDGQSWLPDGEYNNMGSIARMAWSPDGNTLATAVAEIIILWDTPNLTTFTNLGTLEDHTNQVLSLDWSPDGNVLASSSVDGTVTLHTISSGQVLTLEHREQAAYEYVWDISWSPDGTQIVSVGADGKVKFWDTRTGDLLHTIEEVGEIIYSVDWSPDGSQIAYGGAANTFEIIPAP